LRVPVFIAVLPVLLIQLAAFAQEKQPGERAHWKFDETGGDAVFDSSRQVRDVVAGFHKFVPGVKGNALQFDGLSSMVVRKASDAPKMGDSFSVSAWVAINNYPWNWVPVVDYSLDQQSGFYFGVDAFGHLGLQVSVDGVWKSLTSDIRLPLKKWCHIAGTFDPARGMFLYIDGKSAGLLQVHGKFRAASPDWPVSNAALLAIRDAALLIGRVREPTLPVPADSIHPRYPFLYSFDGLMDEVVIYDHALNPAGIATAYASVKLPKEDPLVFPALPSGPVGPGPFGAYYSELKFSEMWDGPRRIGPNSDVVVRFDNSPIRLVFWQGLNYIPAWVTENGKWYTNEFLETWGLGCTDGGDCEPMSDKQERYSHVRILESTGARAVVHWRYALNETNFYKGANVDPLTGWFDWADEYWAVYPDGTAVREQVIWTTDLSAPHEFQESIVVNAPGTWPDDNINYDALTLVNMQGESFTYHWNPKPTGSFERPHGPDKLDRPANPAIQMVNLKSVWKPFIIVPPEGAKWSCYNGEQSYATFEMWNHWPVAQVPSSGRPAVANDRASHTSLSNILWQAYQQSQHTMTKLLYQGLTPKAPIDIIPRAKSWLSPAKIHITGQGFRSEGFDPPQRAYLVIHEYGSQHSGFSAVINGTDDSPIVNPALVVKNWGDVMPKMQVDGKLVTWDSDFRFGLVRTIEGTDLVIWMNLQSRSTTRIKIWGPGSS
jgi:hypothetical protein